MAEVFSESGQYLGSEPDHAPPTRYRPLDDADALMGDAGQTLTRLRSTYQAMHQHANALGDLLDLSGTVSLGPVTVPKTALFAGAGVIALLYLRKHHGHR